MQLYTKAQVYINSGLLAEEASVSVKRISGAQVVKTVAKGLAGMSPGSPMMEVSIKSAVPSADFELNPGSFIKSLGIAELTVFAAGRTLTTKCFITEDTFAHAVDNESTLDMSLICEFADWE